jgi:hypothetical protein
MSQFKYKFEKYDFKRFLLDSDPSRFRSEKFIFWVGKIPLPDDIIYKIFDDRGDILALYVDHVISMLTMILLPESLHGGLDALEKYPCPENPFAIDTKMIEKVYKKNATKISEIENEISKYLLLDGYRCSSQSIVRCLSHSGKKYNRIFLPIDVRKIIEEQFPAFDYNAFRAQSDMFGNVIADHYGIYRSGFSDALSGLFNKLVEFLISGYKHNEGQLVDAPSEIRIKVDDSKSGEALVVSKKKDITDGSLWEPAFIGSKLGFYFDDRDMLGDFGSGGIDSLIIQGLSEMELNAFNEKERKMIEYLRRDLSRVIKSKIDRKKNEHG